jgi:hypothetical protein
VIGAHFLVLHNWTRDWCALQYLGTAQLATRLVPTIRVLGNWPREMHGKRVREVVKRSNTSRAEEKKQESNKQLQKIES